MWGLVLEKQFEQVCPLKHNIANFECLTPGVAARACIILHSALRTMPSESGFLQRTHGFLIYFGGLYALFVLLLTVPVFQYQ